MLALFFFFQSSFYRFQTHEQLEKTMILLTRMKRPVQADNIAELFYIICMHLETKYSVNNIYIWKSDVYQLRWSNWNGLQRLGIDNKQSSIFSHISIKIHIQWVLFYLNIDS